MSWAAIARREVRNLRQIRSTRWLLYLVVVVYTFGAYLFPAVTGNPPDPTAAMSDFPGFMVGAVVLYVPLVAVTLGHKAIVAERESGELALTLSLPNTRRDVVLGKLAARGGLLVAALLAGLLVAAGLVIYPYGTIEPLTYLGYTVLTLLFALAFFHIALAISTYAPGERVATVVAIGVFALFVVLWDLVREAVAVALEAVGLTAGGLPAPARFVLGAEPVSAYERVISTVWGSAADQAWYMDGPVAALLLVLWAVVPLLVGYRRFRGIDL